MAELGRQALAVLDSAGVERTSVAGLSLGGMVALWLALHAPHRIESLVLCATAAWLGPRKRWLDRAALVRAEGLEPIAESVLERWVDWEDRQLPAGVEIICRRMLTAITPEGFAACSEAVAGFDARPELAAIGVPTTILVAEHDEAATAIDAQVLADGITGARLTFLGGRSHLLTLARPAEVTEAVWSAVAGSL
jgi:pimeloyl-ACP methyl ester carboxylesterase